MKNHKRTITIISLMTPISNLALANPSTFSPMLVSPAQNQRFQESRVDSQYTHSTRSALTENPNTNVKEENETSGHRIEAKGFHKLEQLPATLGISSAYDNQTTGEGSATESDQTVKSVTPSMSYSLREDTTIGAEVGLYTVDQQAQINDASSQSDDSYMRTALGANYKKEQWEAGLSYTPQVEDHNIPESLKIHGSYQVTPIISAGGIIERVAYEKMDEDSKNIIKTSLVAEANPVPQINIHGLYQYKPAHFKQKEQMNFDNIGSQKVLMGADYSISHQMKVGGFIADEFAEESYQQTAYEDDELTVGIRAGLDI